jgi:drug/metabolite transporter (DMT)-like permease
MAFGLPVPPISPAPWVLLALGSALLTSLRHLYIKKWCRDVPAEALIFTTRLFGTLVLLPGIAASGIHVSDAGRFGPVLMVTVVLTALATIIQIRIIQKEALSRSIPFLSFVPLCMIPWTALFFGDVPGLPALGGIALTCIGAYLLNLDKGMNIFDPVAGLVRFKVSRLMLAAALMLGCTTACDKIAIAASSGFSYALIWTAVSAVVMLGLAARHGRTVIVRALRSGHTLAQACLWTGSFLAQMIAVQSAIAVPSGVTFVKTLTMTSVLVTVGIGGRIFREGRAWQSFLASAAMVGGAIIVVTLG